MICKTTPKEIVIFGRYCVLQENLCLTDGRAIGKSGAETRTGTLLGHQSHLGGDDWVWDFRVSSFGS